MAYVTVAIGRVAIWALPEVGFQKRLLPDGFQFSVPVSDPANEVVPEAGIVCMMVSVNVDPARMAAALPGVHAVQVTTKSPRSTSVGAIHAADGAPAYMSVNPPNVHELAVQLPPLNEPDVEKVTTCPVTGSETRVTTAAPITIARA
jgi:hypothetical protein